MQAYRARGEQACVSRLTKPAALASHVPRTSSARSVLRRGAGTDLRAGQCRTGQGQPPRLRASCRLSDTTPGHLPRPVPRTSSARSVLGRGMSTDLRAGQCRTSPGHLPPLVGCSIRHLAHPLDGLSVGVAVFARDAGEGCGVSGRSTDLRGRSVARARARATRLHRGVSTARVRATCRPPNARAQHRLSRETGIRRDC